MQIRQMGMSHWEEIRKVHFDPQGGAPFWLRRAAERGVDVFRDVHGEGDFWKLGELTLETLRAASPDEFLPASFRGEKRPFESAGTAGEPAITYFSPDEFERAFVAPFLRAVRDGLFPTEGPWLYVGPTGPHAVGRAAEFCALAACGQAPFTVDFDPRWAKKLPAGSMSSRRYLLHICEQALRVANKVSVRSLFLTPPVLDVLSERLDPRMREAMSGVQIAGMGVEERQWALWREAFPNARFLIGYGNSLAGVFYPAPGIDGYLVEGERVRLSVVPAEGEDRISRTVPEGVAGQVILHRLDRTILYLNLCERDQAVLRKGERGTFVSQVSPLPSLRTIQKGFY